MRIIKTEFEGGGGDGWFFKEEDVDKAVILGVAQEYGIPYEEYEGFGDNY